MYKNLLGHRILAKFFTWFLLIIFSTLGFGWNATGHRLVAQIAVNHMSFGAKQWANNYNHAMDKWYKAQNFIESAVWLDTLRVQNSLWMGERHYINLPFSKDGTPLLPPKPINAVTAIEEAKKVLASDASDFEKGMSLRILLHVVADIHQPMHAVSQFSKENPRGDKGGNLHFLGRNPIAANLHSYWDTGGGFLSHHKKYSKNQLEKKAATLLRSWPCDPSSMNLDSEIWAKESQAIAIGLAYQLQKGDKPTKAYELAVKRQTQKQLALAGCRLAALLNFVSKNKS